MSGFDLNHALFLDGVFIPGPGSDGSIVVPPPVFATQAWQYLSMSSDGTKMVGVAFDGYAWLSTDSGVTWTHQTDPGVKGWYSAAISDDGQVVVLAEDDGSGSLWTSQDGGVTWFEQTVPGARDWTGCALTSDGTKAIAVTSGSGAVWTSSNSAVTWSAQSNLPSGSNASDVRYSDDGMVAIVGRNAGGASTSIYLSTDHGATFTEVPNFTGDGNVSGYVCASSDGAVLCSFARSDVFNISTDSGATWVSVDSGAGSNEASGVACSDNGAGIVFCALSDGVWHSANTGAAWADVTPVAASTWSGAAMSANGQTIAAGNLTTGAIYVSTDGGSSWNTGTLA